MNRTSDIRYQRLEMPPSEQESGSGRVVLSTREPAVKPQELGEVMSSFVDCADYDIASHIYSFSDISLYQKCAKLLREGTLENFQDLDSIETFLGDESEVGPLFRALVERPIVTRFSNKNRPLRPSFCGKATSLEEDAQFWFALHRVIATEDRPLDVLKNDLLDSPSFDKAMIYIAAIFQKLGQLPSLDACRKVIFSALEETAAKAIRKVS